MRKSALTLMSVIGVFWGFVGQLAAETQPQILIKLATLAPKNTALARVMEKVDKELRSRTKGEVGFRVYYGGIQGDEKEAIQKIKFKQLHGGMFTAVGLHEIVPEVHVLSLPYLFRNYDEVAYVRNAIKGDLERKFLAKGYVVANWGDSGFVYGFSKIPIKNLETAKKQKYWQWGDDPVGMAVFKVIGVTPVDLSITDVMTSLSANLIDAASAPPSMAVALRWYTKFKYMNEYPFGCVQGATIVRKEIWDKISPASQKIMKDLSQRHYDEYVKQLRQDDAQAVQLLKKAGIKIVRVSKQEESEVLKFSSMVSQKVREELVGKLYSREFLNKVLGALQEYRDRHPDSKIVKIE